MNYRETDVVFENSMAWVLNDRTRKCYTVFRRRLTCSESDTSYEKNEDGLSLAIARAAWLDRPTAIKLIQKSTSPKTPRCFSAGVIQIQSSGATKEHA